MSTVPTPETGGTRLFRFTPALALAVALLFLALMFRATSGHFIPQVVDLYVICQYARAMAEGHPFRYYLQDAPSTGATSFLHTVLLALGYRIGFHGEGLVAFAIATGVFFYVSSVVLAGRVAAALTGPREGRLASALVALGGPVVWGFLYGADIALFAFLCLWLFERLLAAGDPPRAGPLLLPAALLALSRPEGFLLAVMVALFWATRAGRSARARTHVLAWVPALLGFGLLVLVRAMTGSWLGSSASDKSLILSHGPEEALGVVTSYGADVLRGLLLGFYPSQAPVGFSRGWAPLYFPPLGLLLVMLCAATVRPGLRRPLYWWLATVALLFAFVSPNLFLGIHFNRHILWAMPGLLALVASGLGLLTRLMAGQDDALERRLFGWSAGLLLLLGLLSTLRFATLYGEFAGHNYRRDFAAAQWITRNLPAGVTMANAGTGIEYLTGHYNLNLHGVTSPAFFGFQAAERDSATLEGLARIPEAQRPPYLLTTFGVQETYLSLRTIATGEPLFRTTSFGDDIAIYRTNYELIGRNRQLYLPETLRAIAGRQEVDRLNVGDGPDETAHRYRFESKLGELLLHGMVRVAEYQDAGGKAIPVPDAGRAILGGESFEVNSQPGREMLIVMRTAEAMTATVRQVEGGGTVQLAFSDAAARLEVDGQPVGRFNLMPRSGWTEAVLHVPPTLVTRTRTRISLTGRYASFYYWFYQ